jgi:small subunit ribosomal protein S4
MSRYTGSKFKRSRRVNMSTLETGKELLKRPYSPGQHGKSRKSKLSNYGVQLTEKQKIRFTYDLTEKQLLKTFKNAQKIKGVAGENFLRLLESRLDNIVYRMGISNTRSGSRQLVNHGHILVNNHKVDIASYKVMPGDVISIREKSKDLKVIKESLEKVSKTVEYVSFDKTKLEGTYIRLPERNELTHEFNESLVVEFYSR